MNDLIAMNPLGSGHTTGQYSKVHSHPPRMDPGGKTKESGTKEDRRGHRNGDGDGDSSMGQHILVSQSVGRRVTLRN
jgi:hypothetical protein